MKSQKVINLYNNNNLEFIVHGQGILLFRNNNVQASVFKIMNDYNDGLIIYIDNASSVIKRISNNSVYGYSNKGLIDNSDASYWFSLDSQNLILRIGIGEARLETQIFNYEFPKDNLENMKQNKLFLESLKYITDLINTTPIKLIRDPIVTTVPLIVKKTDQLTMDDVASNIFLR